MLKSILFVVLVVQLTIGDDSHESIKRTPKFITIVYRHGARNPVSSYKNDPYKNRTWPGGLGALSTHGSVQMYTLGKYLRQRYLRLLPADGLYSKENMQIISSAEERSIMSAESFMASFLRPSPKNSALKIPWQPAAITTIPGEKDNILFQIASPCPRYDKLFRKYLHDPDPDTDIYKFNQKYTDMLRYISKHSGENITNILRSILVYDSLQVLTDYGLELPEWAKPIFPEKWRPLRVRTMQVFTETPYMKRIRGGPLITEIVNKMMRKQRGEITQNMYIYSGHDSTLLNMLSGMNMHNQTNGIPDYGAALIFEMHCDDQMAPEDCVIEIWYYLNTNDQNPELMKIPNCENPCSLRRFLVAIEDVVIQSDEYEEECKLI